jgi:hypothetical protein
MSEQASDAKNFALFIEMACDEFGLLDSLIKGKIQIVPSDPRNLRAAGSIQMVLARSFVFDVARAYRICKHGRFLQNHPNERKSFLRYLEKIELVDIWEVNEHGFEAGYSKRGGRKRKTPSKRSHELDGMRFGIDETSLVIWGDKVLMGPVNLCDVHERVEEMRQLAGFASLQTTIQTKATATKVSGATGGRVGFH